MNVYDTANKLANEIKNSQEYENYKKAKEEINQEPELKAKLEEFDTLRAQIQITSMQGQQPVEEELKKMQNLYLGLLQNSKIKEYFDFELKFNVLLTDVNKIIAEAVKDVLG